MDSSEIHQAEAKERWNANYTFLMEILDQYINEQGDQVTCSDLIDLFKQNGPGLNSKVSQEADGRIPLTRKFAKYNRRKRETREKLFSRMKLLLLCLCIPIGIVLAVLVGSSLVISKLQERHHIHNVIRAPLFHCPGDGGIKQINIGSSFIILKATKRVWNFCNYMNSFKTVVVGDTEIFKGFLNRFELQCEQNVKALEITVTITLRQLRSLLNKFPCISTLRFVGNDAFIEIIDETYYFDSKEYGLYGNEQVGTLIESIEFENISEAFIGRIVTMLEILFSGDGKILVANNISRIELKCIELDRIVSVQIGDAIHQIAASKKIYNTEKHVPLAVLCTLVDDEESDCRFLRLNESIIQLKIMVGGFCL